MNNVRTLLLSLVLLGPFTNITLAQDVFLNKRASWMAKAESYRPKLTVTPKLPIQLVDVVIDSNAFQDVKAVAKSNISEFYKMQFSKPKSVILDFGEHITGTIKFALSTTGPADSPARLKFTYGEIPADLYYSLDTLKPTITRAWIQDEEVYVDVLPNTIRLPRRHSFRYLKIELLYSVGFTFNFSEVSCAAVSSAGLNKFPDTEQMPSLFKEINKASRNTLKECMQTVLEDGPKRDQRIWIGDFRLQALANYYSFKNFDIVKRGFYLFAATVAKSGLLYGTVFEKPIVRPQEHHPIDYCLLYNTSLLDYYEQSHDLETLEDLWELAKKQVEIVAPHVDEKGLIVLAPTWWSFVDWNASLDKQVSMQGLVISTFESTLKIAKLLKKEHELPKLEGLITKMRKGAKENYLDSQVKLFVSGKDHQVSVASQVWMILGGVVTPNEGRLLLKKINSTSSIKPVSPYMYHYYVEALIKCKMYSEARDFIAKYWGGMIKKGADTFWEVYDPENEFLSPYNSFLLNSYCHAWSCTPVYFLKKYEKELNLKTH
ncbi:MAG TPA: hypothetical protein VF691_08910 [Cytophagaceae bacterium]